jgi:salicylate hydroxylase
MSSPNKSILEIAIVGAGIGGLATGIGLRRAGHNVRVFEKSKFANEVGAAIVIPANVDGIMKKLGIDSEKHGANLENVRSFRSMNGDLMFEQDYTGQEAAGRLIHRVDLHEALKTSALSEGVEIILGSTVVAIDPTAATVALKTGALIKADAVIIADGVHSNNREFVDPKAPSPSVFHISMFRMLIPCSKLAECPDTTIFLNPPGKLSIYMVEGGRRVVAYPCRSNTVMNAAGLYPSSLFKEHDSPEAVQNQLNEIFSDFHVSCTSLFKAATDVSQWRLYDLQPLNTWVSGRAALMGDAAHPVLPYAAQGGAQALEDAAALSVFLGRGTTAEQVPERLRLFYENRHERAEWVQEFARSADHADPDSKPSVDPAKFFELVHNHDAWEHAEAGLEKFLKSQ